MNPKESKKFQIRNSTAEFLIFTGQAGENSIEVQFTIKVFYSLTTLIMEQL